MVERLSATVGILMVLAVLGDVAALNADGFASVVGIRRPAQAPVSQFADGPARLPPDVAEALAEEGIAPGTDIALVGDGINAKWAYLAGVRIVAEVLPHAQGKLWGLTQEREEEVLRAFADAGAAFVVAEAPPADTPPHAPWRPLANIGFWYAPLR